MTQLASFPLGLDAPGLKPAGHRMLKDLCFAGVTFFIFNVRFG